MSSGPPPTSPPPRRRLASLPDEGDWDQWGRHVLSTLERLEQDEQGTIKRIERHSERLKSLEIALAVLTTKVALYAALIAAAMTALIQVAITLFRK